MSGYTVGFGRFFQGLQSTPRKYLKSRFYFTQCGFRDRVYTRAGHGTPTMPSQWCAANQSLYLVKVRGKQQDYLLDCLQCPKYGYGPSQCEELQ